MQRTPPLWQKVKVAKKPLDESERGEQKSWLKAQHSENEDHGKLWKILKGMGIPDDLTCLLRNLYAGQEATVRTGHGTTDWFQIGKGVR